MYTRSTKWQLKLFFSIYYICHPFIITPIRKKKKINNKCIHTGGQGHNYIGKNHIAHLYTCTSVWVSASNHHHHRLNIHECCKWAHHFFHTNIANTNPSRKWHFFCCMPDNMYSYMYYVFLDRSFGCPFFEENGSYWLDFVLFSTKLYTQ